MSSLPVEVKCLKDVHGSSRISTSRQSSSIPLCCRARFFWRYQSPSVRATQGDLDGFISQRLSPDSFAREAIAALVRLNQIPHHNDHRQDNLLLPILNMGNSESGAGQTSIEDPALSESAPCKALPASTAEVMNSSESAPCKALPASTAEATTAPETECHDPAKGEKQKGDTSPSANEDNEKAAHADFKAWADDFFEREYTEHQWSAGAHISSSPISILVEPGEAVLRYLEPDEELLSESEESEDEQEPFMTWSNRTRLDAATSSNLSMRAMQWCMDKDKEYWGGKALPEHRQKSCWVKRSIGDRVERGRRIKWAEEMGRRYPGRYVPYPGRPVRAPRSWCRVEKGRRLQRKK
ncbi:hypothetical protein CLCR_02993 [Cladophialophora carrionii]|uniref:Uncharacterized protein n=1 Tax=Cladophialophora carrionii TaxID=86049 RepID=A0A1C1D1E9_9EURO|nr:hypothetical protein CLCR_02993 [Cladophialophora carrionii]